MSNDVKIKLGIKKIKKILSKENKPKIQDQEFGSIETLQKFLCYAKEAKKYRMLALIKNKEV